MSTPLLIPVGYQFFDNSGKPLSGGFLYTYAAGTTSPQNTYSDNGLSVLNPNPIPLDSAGRCSVSGTEINVYPLTLNYKIVLTDVNGVQIWSHDFVDPAAGWDVAINALAASGIVLTAPVITGGSITSATISAATLTTSVSGLLAQVCQGRLTLTTATPVTTGDVTGATSIFFTPYTGNLIGLFDGVSVWTALAFSELTLNLGTLTSGLPYDVFAFNNNGVVALRTPVAWTNTTTRATALVLQNGIYVKSGATTDRYLGTFYTTATTTTEDSAAKRYLWNYYNRVQRALTKSDATNSWTYTTATIRQANGAAGNQVELVVGVAEVMLDLVVNHMASNNNATAVFVSTGIGEDSTSAYTVGQLGESATSIAGPLVARLTKFPVVGRHFYSWNEFSAATGATTWFGTNTSVGSSTASGLTGFILG